MIGVLEQHRGVGGGTVEPSPYLLDTYPALRAYSLQKLKQSATAAIRVRRSSDNTQTDVFLEDSGSITLNSITGTGLTLGEFVGSGSAFVAIWYDQSGNGFELTQGVSGDRQPRIVNNGVLDVRNALAALDFLSTTTSFFGGAINQIAAGNPFSIYTVASANASGSVGAIFSSTWLSDRFVIFRDARNTPNRNSFVQIGSTAYTADLSQSRTGTNPILLTTISSGSTLSAWDNGIVGGQNIPFTGSYDTNSCSVGVQLGSTSPLDGTLQELIIRTGVEENRAEIEADINSRYSIFV